MTGKAPRRWRVAAVQMTSTEDREANLAKVEALAARAAASGAALIALPENFAYLRREGSRVPHPESLKGELVGRLSALASRLGCHLLAGSIPEKIAGSPKVYNTSVLFDDTGRLLASYRKIHLFDVRMRGKAVFEESRVVAAGKDPVVVETSLGTLGLSICYDLRFPELYRGMALAGAQVILIPSAFTDYTGRHHWMTLIRARAIENQCWVVAPAQVGRHNPSRQSHGHTAIVDPWGTVVALEERNEGIVSAEIDLDQLDKIRAGLPCLDHVRKGLLGKVPKVIARKD